MSKYHQGVRIRFHPTSNLREYYGTIKKVKGDSLFILFDDGSSGWHELDENATWHSVAVSPLFSIIDNHIRTLHEHS